MNKNLTLLFLMCSFWIGCIQTIFGQNLFHSSIDIGKKPNAMFLFTRKWDYPWNVSKDGKGKWHKVDGDTVNRQDTAHLYFTASCKTNVQGGYRIRYCYVTKTAGNIRLNFSDGSPAYASEFNIILDQKKFTFEPEIIYPVFEKDTKVVYKVTKCKLILYQKKHLTSKTISGYVNAQFDETVSKTKGTVLNKYYFRGYFESKVN
ncbi:MAG: hypothetical protein ABI166_16290 [Mucilaginibacter sp.]